ncbi:uncharacterized protein LOC131050636 [Cryptomeria japonica]|uniref:uncharacterized protein LOC131050636 n=1 Tax=Cryptomeria japonica TaxID=3369 RepID=UPI0027DA876F|nr:uncharacterized protein LOC131050636 [Cryptomeria japonica]
MDIKWFLIGRKVMRVNINIENESKYIGKLIHKAQVRKQEQEIIYERQLAKERSKEDHLYADKEKFVTSAYKKKLAEQAQWLEEERLRKLREEADDVTKKGDMGDFYRNLLKKNVAFGANTSKRGDDILPSRQNAESGKSQPSETHSEKQSDLIDRKSSDLTASNVPDEPKPSAKHGRSEDMDKDNIELRLPSTVDASQADSGLQSEKGGITADIGSKAETVGENVKSSGHHHRQSQEALAAAKERYLARKRMREG